VSGARTGHGRALRGAGATLAVALLCVARGAGAAAPVEAVGPIGFTVADAGRSASFFEEVLGFERVGDVELAGPGIERLQGVFPVRLRAVRLRLGREELELSEYLAPAGRPLPDDARSNDLWFQHVAIVVSDMAAAYARLREHRVAHASSGPQRLPDWNPSAGGIEAFYFRDPDGHFLELIQFPPGKGDPRWQDGGGRLFLGIDHTAIVVDDTERSLGFWRDELGLRVAGASENYGPEQERLNAVFGARLRITALRAERGPGVELLEYLAPGGGRPRPPDARANDRLHWQTSLVTPDVQALARRLAAAGASFDSPGDVALEDGALGFREAVLAADPDGHRIRGIEALED
jgi:catechol 2,3-dioxygenase-like lactoylglutathione lyase family enzyme